MSDSSHSLIQAYVANRSEQAFRQLVDHHMPLVYSTALRRTSHSSGMAQDVAQEVFTRLAKKAPTLGKEISLGGWLYRQTCRIAANHIRSETRRLKREKIATEMMTTPAPENPLLAHLDEALLDLQKPARDALILRFFEEENHRAIGHHLGISDDAARKRIDRALESLRTIFEKRGLRVSTPLIIAALTGLNTKTLPAATTAKISSQALTSPVLQTSLSTLLGAILAGALGVSAVAGSIHLTSPGTPPSDQSRTTTTQNTATSTRKTPPQKDLIARIKQICRGPDHALNILALKATLSEIDDPGIPEFAAFSSDLLSPSEYQRCHEFLLKRWFLSDPPAAIDFYLHNDTLSKNFKSDLPLSSWIWESPTEVSDWILANWEPLQRSRLRFQLESILHSLVSSLREKNGVPAQFDLITKLPVLHQAKLLERICGTSFIYRANTGDIPQLLDHLNKVPDPSLRTRLHSALWTGWAETQPEKMLEKLAQLPPTAAFRARLALMGGIRVEGKPTTRFVTGSFSVSQDEKAYASAEERVQHAITAGLATGLSEREVFREIARWHADQRSLTQFEKLLPQIGHPHGLDDSIEQNLRFELLSKEPYESSDLKMMPWILLMEDPDRRQQLTRAYFRYSVSHPFGFPKATKFLKETPLPTALHAELKAILNSNVPQE